MDVLKLTGERKASSEERKAVIRFRIYFKVLMLMNKALNGLGPRYLAERLLPPSSTHVTRARQDVRLRSLMPREARK